MAERARSGADLAMNGAADPRARDRAGQGASPPAAAARSAGLDASDPGRGLVAKPFMDGCAPMAQSLAAEPSAAIPAGRLAPDPCAVPDFTAPESLEVLRAQLVWWRDAEAIAAREAACLTSRINRLKRQAATAEAPR